MGGKESLAVAREIRSKEERARALTRLTLHLPLSGEALAAAREIGDTWCRVQALASLTLCLPEPLREQILEEVLVTEWEI